jgi:hypothetical protein
MKKLIIYFVFGFIFFNFSFVGINSTYAQTILPQGDTKINCKTELQKLEVEGKSPKEIFSTYDSDKKNNILACAIKTGKVHFWMIPFFIVYIIEFLIGIAGLLAIAFIVIGGYQFIISGATEKRDEAKNTIMNAVLGLILAIVAWVIVNIVQYALTF